MDTVTPRHVTAGMSQQQLCLCAVCHCVSCTLHSRHSRSPVRFGSSWRGLSERESRGYRGSDRGGDRYDRSYRDTRYSGSHPSFSVSFLLLIITQPITLSRLSTNHLCFWCFHRPSVSAPSITSTSITSTSVSSSPPPLARPRAPKSQSTSRLATS